MKTIIAGTRTIDDYDMVRKYIAKSGFDISIVLCGEAKGVDSMGKLWAKENQIPVWSFPADWAHFGKFAGIERNNRMADAGDALILIWDGESKGSKNMRYNAIQCGLMIYEVIVSPLTTIAFHHCHEQTLLENND
jgi:hypothetical protein